MPHPSDSEPEPPDPFKFYDLKDESETELDIFPFAVMDVTLQQYLSLSPDEALDSDHYTSWTR